MENFAIAAITGGISALVSIFGIVMANRKSSALLEYKVDALGKDVKELGSVEKRVNDAEKVLGIHEQRLQTLERTKEGR